LAAGVRIPSACGQSDKIPAKIAATASTPLVVFCRTIKAENKKRHIHLFYKDIF